MISFIIEKVTLIRLFILASLVFVGFFSNKNNWFHQKVFILIVLSFINEFLSAIFIHFNISIGLNTTVFSIIHDSIWLFILANTFEKSNYIKKIQILFILFSGINIFFLQGIERFNTYTFIVGGITYTSIFLIESYKNLMLEKIDFFKSNLFILLFSPVLFFIAFSFIIGFNNKEIMVYKIFNNYYLYTFVGTIANIIYYSLINLYIYKERKLQNG